MSTLTYDCLINIGIFGYNNYSGEELFSLKFQGDSNKTNEDNLLAKKLIDVNNFKFYLKFYQHISEINDRFFFGSKLFIIFINPFEDINIIKNYIDDLDRYSKSDYCYCFFLAKIERDTEKSPIKKGGKSTSYYTKITSIEEENIDCFTNYINYINENHVTEDNKNYFGTYTFLKYDKYAIDEILKDICLKYHIKRNKQNISRYSGIYINRNHITSVSTSRNFFNRFSRVVTNILIPFVKCSSIIILVPLLGIYLTQTFTHYFIIGRD